MLRKGDLEEWLKATGKDKEIKYLSWIGKIKLYCFPCYAYICTWILFYLFIYLFFIWGVPFFL